MTSTIKVNNIQNQCGANIINESSDTITIGASGDTISLASGASQSGFGRTGTVDWVTTIQTSTPFTAVSGKGYFINTTGGAITMNLPSSPSVGDIVAVKDYASNFATANLTIGRGGSNMNGAASDSVRNTDNESLTLVYADSTKGWLAVEEGTGFVGEGFITATGGTITTCGDYKIHTFTGPGTFEVTQNATSPTNQKLEYLVVGGGAGGGGPQGGGGGGAGGLRFASPSIAPATYPAKPLAAPAALCASVQSYPVTVGGGGAGGPGGSGAGGCCSQEGTQGVNSVFSTITSYGGGFGGVGQSGSPRIPESRGAPGASGGGGGGRAGPGTPTGAAGGTGNQPPVSPAQGTNGGTSRTTSSPPVDDRGGGGGGALVAGGSGGASGDPAGPGGNGGGFPTAFGSNGVPCGSFRYYAGGGGGGLDGGSGSNGTGGKGGGAAGINSCTPGSNATVNTGGGGGGAGTSHPLGGTNGGSGIVVIRYKFQ